MTSNNSMTTTVDPRHCMIPNYIFVTDIVDDVYTAREVKKFIRGSKCMVYRDLEQRIDRFLKDIDETYTKAVTVMILVEALKNAGALSDKFMVENLDRVVKSLSDVIIPEWDTSRIELPKEVNELYDHINRRDNGLI